MNLRRFLPPLMCLLSCLALLACLTLADAVALRADEAPTGKLLADELPRIAPQEPAEALKSLRVLTGFRIEQAAVEPLVRDPVALSFDERGRAYVVEMCDYSEQDRDFLGQVSLLEDADGDGRFDKSTIFADKISWPTAVIAYDGGVFVGAAPHIYYLKDTNGDGHADVRELVFTGFRRNNVQGMLNSFHWGLDNRIHGSASLNGGSITRHDAPRVPAVNLAGRDFSFDPRTRELRAESGGAQHGMSFDDWGRKFVSSNSDHIQLVMYEDRYVRRNPHLAAPGARISIAADGPQAEVHRLSPVEPWRIVRTRQRVSGTSPGVVEGGGRAAGYFTGASGVTIYRGDAWPAEHRGTAFIGDVGSNIVHRKRLEPRGVEQVARRVDQGREFVASTDIWFRPAQFANAPDGTLYILDVYREVIEHPHSIPPDIKRHLNLASGRDRGRIYRVVAENHRQRPLPALDKRTLKELTATLEHANGWHRDTAARLLYERNDAAAAPALEHLVFQSPVSLARMHSLYSLHSLKKLADKTLLAALGDKDPRVREHALRLSEARFNESPALRAAALKLAGDDDPHVRLQLAFSLGEMADPARLKALAALARRGAEDRWMRAAVQSSVAAGAERLFAALLRDPASPGADALLQALARQIGAQKENKEIIDVAQGVSESIEDPLRAGSLLSELDNGLQRRRLRLHALLAGGPDNPAARLSKWAAATALDADEPLARRAAAVRLLRLADWKFAQPTAAKLLDPRAPVELQQAALELAGQFADANVADALLAAWPGLGARARSQAAELLQSRPAWLVALLQAIERGDVPLNELNAARLALLEKHADPAVRAAHGKISQRLKLSTRQKAIDAYRPVLEMAGDAARGRQVFVKHCAACHRLEKVGHEVGPNLAAMKNRGAEAILLNVLDPNREVTPQYLNFIVVTADGRTATGMIAAESAASVTLRRGEGAQETILRADIEELRSSGASLMPEGLENQINRQGMADLLAYLMGLDA